MRATRLPEANGVVYELECDCYVCRDPLGQFDGLLCEYLVAFIRSAPKHWRFLLRERGREVRRVAA